MDLTTERRFEVPKLEMELLQGVFDKTTPLSLESKLVRAVNVTLHH